MLVDTPSFLLFSLIPSVGGQIARLLPGKVAHSNDVVSQRHTVPLPCLDGIAGIAITRARHIVASDVVVRDEPGLQTIPKRERVDVRFAHLYWSSDASAAMTPDGSR